MRRKIFLWCFAILLCFSCGLSYAKDTKQKVILLIAEQNIQGPQQAWWASEINLSSTEATLAKRLIEQGIEIIEPSSVTKIIKLDRAFRVVDVSEEKAVKLGNLAKADYVVLGKAVASAGAKVPQSNMISCFGNLTVKLISVKDGRVIAYLDASGNSAHLDAITGGKEALVNSGEDLAIKLLEALKKEEGK